MSLLDERPPVPVPLKFTAHQLGVVFLIAAVQFVNILDFVMVMPMGPDFAKYLHFSEAHTGYIGAAYTGAACISGLIGSTFLDRFDRRKVLAFAIGGLVIGTALGGLAINFETLLAARVVAGAFGGPATAISIAIIADIIPPQLRGRAMGITMGAFSAASILGVPAGLWLSERFTWRAPFLSVAAVGLVVASGAVALLPPLIGHIAAGRSHHATTADLLARPLVQASYGMTAAVMLAGFVIIPNMSAYAQLNLGYPRQDLKLLYLFGGIASFFTTQLAGLLVDRFGSFRVATFGSVLIAGCVYTGYYNEPTISFTLITVWFMIAMGLRNVSYNTLTSKVPRPWERARFQSFQSAVQHGASAFAAGLGAPLLTRVPAEGFPARLEGMRSIAIISLCMTAVIPALIFIVERGVKATPEPPAVAPIEG